jgi:hypothetical protein
MMWVMVAWSLWAGLPLERPAPVGQVGQTRLVFRLTVNQTSAKVAVKDRGAVRIEGNTGRRYSVVPTLEETGVRLQFAEVAVDSTEGTELTYELSSLHLGLNDLGLFEAPGMKISLQWTEVRQITVATEADGCPGERCCISCGGETICACQVITPCGQCCCANRCGCDIVDRPSPQAPPTACVASARRIADTLVRTRAGTEAFLHGWWKRLQPCHVSQACLRWRRPLFAEPTGDTRRFLQGTLHGVRRRWKIEVND